MLELLVPVQIKALHLLGACQGHAHLPILFILISILLLHFPYLSMFAPLNLPLVHELVIVFLFIAIILLLVVILSASLFAPLIRLLVTLLVLLATVPAFIVPCSPLLPIVIRRSILLPVIVVLSGFFTDLHNGYLAIIIIVTKFRSCASAHDRGRLRPELSSVLVCAGSVRGGGLRPFHDQLLLLLLLVLQLLHVLAAVPLADVVGERLLAHAEHQREAQLQPLRLQKVALAPNYKRTCGYEHAGGGRLGDLVGVDPVDLGGDLVFPARTVAHFERGCFIETKGWNRLATRVFQDANSSSMQL